MIDTGAEASLGAPGALLVIISGPSGVGKDTIIEELKRRNPDAHRCYVITCTTRPRRVNEVDGVHYHFLSSEAFHALRLSGGLLEANEVHGNWYGTPRDQVVAALAEGRDAVLKIDVQGARAVRRLIPDAFLIFVVPPSLEALAERLEGRSTETPDALRRRHGDAAGELARQVDFDAVVVNETGQVAGTAADIEQLMAAEHQHHPRRRIRI